MNDERILSYECTGEETGNGLRIEVYNSGRVVKSTITHMKNSPQERKLGEGEVKNLVKKIAAYKFIQSNKNPHMLMVLDGEHVKIEISLEGRDILYETSNTAQFSSLYCREIKTLEDLFK